MRSLIPSLLALIVFTMGCSTPASRTSAPLQLRVLSYNIHHGEGTDGKLDLLRIASVIKSVQPDLVALQEVDRRAQRTLGIDQADELGRLTGLHSYYGRAMDFQGGQYGQALLSRAPLDNLQVLQLPQRPGREPRIALSAQSRLPAFQFIGTHLDHEHEAIRLDQVRELNRSFPSSTNLPAILLGDFNSRPESAPMSILLSQWQDAAAAHAEPTIPSDNPRHRIDFILLHPASRWKVIESKVLPESVASDHRPVFAIIELTPASP